MKLSNIRIVLVETSHPGNIGAAARAMKNMCVSELFLVNPKEFPSAAATARASGADDLLARAKVCTDLEEALKDCSVVIGASARLRSIEWPQLNPRECAELVHKNSNVSSVAIIFGREDSGLSNRELDYCHYLVHIPTNPEYQSLNLAAAVQVICYEIFSRSKMMEIENSASSSQMPATSQQMSGFYKHLETALTEIGFLKPPSCQKLLRRLKRLFNRAAMDETDINIMRGILSAAEGRKYDWQARKQRK